jgi:transposase
MTTTFVAGLRAGGLVAPMVADAPMDGQIFLAWVERFLCPTLQPDDIVILDNLASHKVAGVAQAIESVHARLLYLPPYSPDLNPIEQVFAKLKALLRRSSQRTLESLWRQIGKLLDHFSPDECRNYISAAGYVSN